MSDLMRGERLQIMLSPEELAIIDDFRFTQRMPSRAAAIRELLKVGLAEFVASSDGAKPSTRSTDYGVFGRGPHGHKETDGASET